MNVLVFVETRDGERRYVTLADTPRLALALHRPDALPVDGWGARAILRRLRTEARMEFDTGHRPFVIMAGTEAVEAACACPGCRRAGFGPPADSARLVAAGGLPALPPGRRDDPDADGEPPSDPGTWCRLCDRPWIDCPHSIEDALGPRRGKP